MEGAKKIRRAKKEEEDEGKEKNWRMNTKKIEKNRGGEKREKRRVERERRGRERGGRE